VAIEALPTTFERLEENLASNGCGNVRAVNLAAAEREGTLRVFRGPDSHTGLATVVEDFGYEYERDVAAAPLSSVLEDDELTRARVIKIDVEGAELGVSTGLRAALARTRPDLEIVIEMHPSPLGQQGHRPQDVADVLAADGFHPYGLDVEYSAESFVRNGVPARPRRLDAIPDHEMDVVFSREDRDAL
jgi:FkbM family methyltransferase